MVSPMNSLGALCVHLDEEQMSGTSITNYDCS